MNIPKDLNALKACYTGHTDLCVQHHIVSISLFFSFPSFPITSLECSDSVKIFCYIIANAACRSYTPLNAGEEDRIQQLRDKVESVGVYLICYDQSMFPDVVQLVINLCWVWLMNYQSNRWKILSQVCHAEKQCVLSLAFMYRRDLSAHKYDH